MKGCIAALLLFTGLFLLLQACTAGGMEPQDAAPDPTAMPNQNTVSVPVSETLSEPEEEEDGGVEQGFTLEDAESDFKKLHPDAELTVAKEEGDAYYLEGWQGSRLTKMNFSKDD